MGKLLVAGGGIGGPVAAVACARVGAQVEWFGGAAEFTEVGCSIQLGPNAMRVLYGLGLKDALQPNLAFPERLVVRSALTGSVLGHLPLGEVAQQRYGAPYATIHRADLHALLVQTARPRGDVQLNLNSAVLGVVQTEAAVSVQPVSYTHLDVYKRQEQAIVKHLGLPPAPAAKASESNAKAPKK